MTFNSDPQTGIRNGLQKAAEFFVDKMSQRISSNNLTSAIIDATSIDPPTDTSIEVKIDIEAAPMAGAFEYGSGLWSERGARETYRIPGEGGADYVAFPASRWPEGFSFVTDPNRGLQDKYVFTFVNHPGVAARPYIRPTIRDNKKEIAQIIGREFIASISRGGTVEIIE